MKKIYVVFAVVLLVVILLTSFVIAAIDLSPGFKFKEFFNKNLCEKRDELKAELIERYDVDGDGELTKGEMYPVKKTKKLELIEKYDADGDGKLCKEEWRVFLEDNKKNAEKKGFLDWLKSAKKKWFHKIFG